MKFSTIFAFVCSLILQATVFAKAQPVAEEVELTNKDFAKAIYEALEKNKKPKKAAKMAGGEMLIIDIAKGFSCYKHTSKKPSGTKVSYNCIIPAGQSWNSYGNSTYGSNDKVSKALYAALGVSAEVEEIDGEEIMSSKTIEMNFKDDDGGTQRNLLTCISNSEDSVAMGIKPFICTLTNAL